MINTADYTTEDIATGTGIFDVLMRTVKLHLMEEFNSNRIKGNDYASAYVSLVGQVLQIAAQYAVAKPESDAKIVDMELLRDSNLAINIANKEKSEQEVALLFAKVQTEKANVCEQVQCSITGAAVPVLGVIGKQKTLYQNQAEGYIKDHTAKVAKIFADMAAVQISSKDAYSNGYNGLSDGQIAIAMGKLQNSVP